MRKVEEIAEQILNLSAAELAEFREWFAEFAGISDGCFRGNASDPEVDRAWLDEVQRRSAEFDAGSMEEIPAEEVFERVRARLKE